MKKLLAIALLLATCVSFAGVKSLEGYSDKALYTQFTYDVLTNTGDYFNATNPGQNWLGAQTIRLNINSELDLWVSNYVSSWYYPKPLDALDGNVFDMSAGMYGVFNAEREWLGNGQTALVTYYDNATGVTNSTDAYFVGHFNEGDSVYFMMTTLPEDGAQMVNSLQYVYDVAHDQTVLWSRLDGTHDLAGNVRVNFGLEDYVAHEFVAFGVSEPEPPSGQPLPGVLATSIVAFCSIGCVKKLGKKK